MRTRKQSYPIINIGTSYMLVIFIILCLVILSVLSLSSAVKDYSYSQKTADRTASYYKANNSAEERLAEIDSILESAASKEELLRQLDTIDGISFSYSENNDLIIEYQITMSDSDVLQVVLTYIPESSPHYIISTWKQITVSDWNGKQTLPVLGSN